MSGANQRRVFKSSHLSKDYHLHVLVGGLAFVAVLFGFTYLRLAEINRLVASLPDAQLAADLSERILLVTLITFTSTFLFVAFVSVYVTILAHRVGGPTVAILRYIREIREGKYDLERSLRDSDELVPIMNELRELARELAARPRV